MAKGPAGRPLTRAAGSFHPYGSIKIHRGSGFASVYGFEPSHLLPDAVGAALILLMLPLIPRIRRSAEVQNAV
jgi:hypothetical protein